jgi:DNA segregation ATPase FtsK/SpoIIIE-like protein
MAKISRNKKYVNLEGFRVSYRTNDNTIHLTSTDPDFPQGFHLTLKDGSPSEEALRNILIENNIISQKEEKYIPSRAAFPINEDSDPYVFPLGEAADGEVSVNINRNPHFLITGAAGKGKSVVQRNIIAHCTKHKDKWDIYGIENTGELSLAKDKISNFIEVARTPDEALALLRKIHETMLKRFAQMENEGVNSFKELFHPPKSIMLIVDEASYILKANKPEETKTLFHSFEFNDEASDILYKITRIGRAAGIQLALSIQKPDSAIVPNAFKLNFSNKILLGRSNSTVSYLTLGNGEGTNVVGDLGGRGVILSEDTAETKHFQSYYSNVDDILSIKREDL